MENTRVQYLADPAHFREKENLYLEVRRLEGRVLADALVKNLPGFEGSSPLAREWRWRARSLARFIQYLAKRPKNAPLRILDLGCGNGWMANRLAENPNWQVWAADLNELELAQGARLFGRENLRFLYADIPAESWGGDSSPVNQRLDADNLPGFEIVLLAASVQYFPDLEALILGLKKMLAPGGEIHVLDSPFYQNEAARVLAQQRTLDYYTRLGVPAMAGFYHHHLWPQARNLGAKNLNAGLALRFLQKIKWLAPFPWLRFAEK